jgi:heme exporter protein D
MMVDLGKYAGTVLAAYGVSIVLIIGLVAQTLMASRKARGMLDAQEAQAKAAAKPAVKKDQMNG